MTILMTLTHWVFCNEIVMKHAMQGIVNVRGICNPSLIQVTAWS
jgi:hypothetical protein